MRGARQGEPLKMFASRDTDEELICEVSSKRVEDEPPHRRLVGEKRVRGGERAYETRELGDGGEGRSLPDERIGGNAP